MTKRLYVYFHKKTGNILRVTKSEGKKLDEQWQELQFVKNEQGEQVMRFHFDGATVDVSETGDRKVVADGQRSSD